MVKTQGFNGENSRYDSNRVGDFGIFVAILFEEMALETSFLVEGQ